MPVLDDWMDGKPDAWDYEKVLRDNSVHVVWSDRLVDGEGHEILAGEFAGWSMSWKHGVMDIGPTTKTIARKAAALFVSLWLRHVSASFCDKLMDGFICFLERQENTSDRVPDLHVGETLTPRSLADQGLAQLRAMIRWLFLPLSPFDKPKCATCHWRNQSCNVYCKPPLGDCIYTPRKPKHKTQ
jgi:hypothetical protein